MSVRFALYNTKRSIPNDSAICFYRSYEFAIGYKPNILSIRAKFDLKRHILKLVRREIHRLEQIRKPKPFLGTGYSTAELARFNDRCKKLPKIDREDSNRVTNGNNRKLYKYRRLWSTMTLMKRLWKSGLMLLAGAMFSYASLAQNNVSGKITSVPSINPHKAKITFTNTTTGQKNYAVSDSLTGNYSLDLPIGTYERKYESIDHILTQDTVDVSNSQTMDEQLMKKFDMTSDFYTSRNISGLRFFKIETNTYDGGSLFRSRDSPMLLFAHNYNSLDSTSMPSWMRPYLDAALADYKNKTNNIADFIEQSKDSAELGVTKFMFVHDAQMPQPAAAWTRNENGRDVCYFNVDLLDSTVAKSAFERELWRAWDMFTNSGDTHMISAAKGPPQTDSLHLDEANVLMRYLTLNKGTDMQKYRDSIITNIAWPSAPLAPAIISPNGSLENMTTILKWASIGDAYSYHVQASLDSLFKTTIVDDSTTTDTTKTITAPAHSTVYWRVNAKNGFTNSEYSKAKFNIKNTSPSIIKSIDNITMQEGSSKIVDIKGNYFDLDSDAITTSVQGPNGLNLTVANDTIRMFAQMGYFGSANVVVTYDDNHGGIAVDTFNVNVTKSIVKPYIASALRDTTQHKNIASILISSNVKDNIKGDVAQYAVSSTHGTAKLSNDTLTFTPDHGFTGIANVTLSGYNSTDTAKTSSNIQINNTAPSVLVTSPQNGDSVYANTNIQVIAKATDRDGDPLTLTARIKEYNGTLDSLITMVDTLANISSSKLKSNSRYDITVYATDGTDTTKSNTITVYTSTLTGVERIVENIPKNFELYQNYPNPFNPSTVIRYDIPNVGTQHVVSLRVYDILGKEVATLVNESKPPGAHTVTWDASKLSSGVYFYQLNAGKYTSIKKMLLTK